MLLRGRVSLGRCDDVRGWSVSVELMTASFSFMKGKQFCTPYVIAINRCFPEARKNQLDRTTRQSLTVQSCGNCEGEERMARNSLERGARCQGRSGVERIQFFLHKKS